MSLAIEIPGDAAWFEGHFPGRPILPGVAELLLASDTLVRAGLAREIAGVAHARLRQLVGPGDRLELAVRDATPDRLRFDLRRDSVLVANAAFMLGAPEARSAMGIAAPASRPREFPPLDTLLPHRAPMRLLKSVSAASASALHGTAQVPAACALVRDGNASPLAAIEAAAQGAAAWEAIRRRDAGDEASARIGYLVAIRDALFHVRDIPADREFEVSVELDAAAPPLTHYRIRASMAGAVLASATISTYLTDESA